MKKTAENRYPNSAILFKFCKEALELRYNGNVKVIDQDVGAILGYDPADCSHWKKGKKNIRSLATLKNIADHLNIDEHLLINIASGKVGLEEAVFEYKGYGDFHVKGNQLEYFKKEFFKDNSKWSRDHSVKSFEDLFALDRKAIINLVNQIMEMGKFEETPIYLPEVCQLFPQFKAETNLELVNDMKPFMRFQLAKELYKFLMESAHPLMKDLLSSPVELLEIQSNIFAIHLLIPEKLILKEVAKIENTIDLVQQLSEFFWVSKTLMNQRLCDYLEYGY